MEEDKNALRILTGTPVRKRPLGRPMRKWDENIRMDVKGIEKLGWFDSG